jgi:orotate phosphoribosyltransferase
MSISNIDSETGLKVASLLLEIKAVKLNLQTPFVWASGWQSPIYCDNRKSLGYPKIRTYIKDQLVDGIKHNFPNCQAIAGVATAGIPQGALVADSMELPFIYVRSKPKGHGLENLIEGHFVKGQQVVMVEDLISTGGSSLKAVEAVKNAGMQVCGLAAIFTYGFDLAELNFRNAGVDWFSLSDYHTLIDCAAKKSLVLESQISLLEEWRKHPNTWSTGN